MSDIGKAAKDSWEVRASGANFDICLPAEPGARTVAVVATVFSGEADALKIAATPELYRAIDALCGGIGPKLWENARAALVKARGAASRDTDRSGEADETPQAAQPKARAGAEGIAQPQVPPYKTIYRDVV